MARVTQESLSDIIESGRRLPSLPSDEALTAALLKAGFTHRFGVPYSELEAKPQPDSNRDIRIWPAPKKKKPR